MPKKLAVVGYARSQLSRDQLTRNIEAHVRLREEERARFDKFLARNSYVSGAYDQRADLERLRAHVEALEGAGGAANRLFYLALPPNVFAPVTELIRAVLMAKE